MGKTNPSALNRNADNADVFVRYIYIYIFTVVEYRVTFAF